MQTQVTRWKRILLLLLAMVVTWCGYVLLLSLPGHLEVWPLAGWAGIFALVTLVVFAIPLISMMSAARQLRSTPALLLLSLLWSNGLLALFLSQTPREVWDAARHSDLLYFTFNAFVSLFSLSACGLYLLLLARVTKADQKPGMLNGST